MTFAFRRLGVLGDANPDDIVVLISQVGGSAKARAE